MNMSDEIRRRLDVLHAVRIELEDDSERHRGHAGWRDGGATHWRLTIVSPKFAGLPPVARHRMVYQALGDLMRAPIHALEITARAPDERDAEPRSPAS